MDTGPIIRALVDALEPHVEHHGGKVDVSGTPAQTLELLGNKPNNWRTIVQAGEENSIPDTGGRNQTFTIELITQQAKGLTAEFGKPVYDNRGGGPPLLDRVDTLTAFMHSFVATDFQEQRSHPDIDCRNRSVFQKVDGDWLEVDGLPTIQRVTRFEITHAVGQASGRNLRLIRPPHIYLFNKADGADAQASSSWPARFTYSVNGGPPKDCDPSRGNPGDFNIPDWTFATIVEPSDGATINITTPAPIWSISEIVHENAAWGGLGYFDSATGVSGYLEPVAVEGDLFFTITHYRN
ncbi:MAG: hypothetical protein AAGD22_09390 [Verrucomicrobiota bacterium]